MFDELFDRVYCLSLADNIEKREYATLDFKRVGIIGENDIFSWKITIKNPMYRYIWDNNNFKIDSWWKNNDCALNCTFGHYEIIKEALVLGYEHILILEDDCRFHKDRELVLSIFENTPENYDICLYDKCIPTNHSPYLNAILNKKVNDMFFDFSDIKLWSTACYALSRRGMEMIVSEQERYFQPADQVLNRVDNNLNVLKNDGMVRVCSIKNAAVQDFYGKTYNSTNAMYIDKYIYKDIADKSEYNVLE